jgi:hypothetical protein
MTLAAGSLSAALAALLAVGFGATTVGAQPSATTCGSVITQDTTLTGNLTDCTNGLEMAGTTITLDLGSHTISGTGTGHGIYVTGHDVTIKNGRITGFGVGITTLPASPPVEPPTFHLQSLRVVKNAGPGVSVFGYSGFAPIESTIESSKIEDNAGDGIVFGFYGGFKVADSSIRGNGGFGVNQAESGAVYEGNDISKNGRDGVNAFDPYSTTLVGNTLNANGGSGFDYFESYPGPFPHLQNNRADLNAQRGFQLMSISTYVSWEDLDGGGNTAKLNGDSRQCLVEAPSASIPPDVLVCTKNNGGL